MNYTQPTRIQRKRTMGWRMPENTVYVGRGSDWGNPFKLQGDMIYLDCSHRRKIFDPWVYLCRGEIEDVTFLYRLLVNREQAVPYINIHLRKIAPKEWSKGDEINYWGDFVFWYQHFQKQSVTDLKGKNLACWCPLDQPCHADVLLELSNPELNMDLL